MKFIVVDVGGTNLRVGVFNNDLPVGLQLIDVQRMPVQSLAVTQASGDKLYQHFLQQLKNSLQPYLTRHPDSPVGISFPGPVTPEGVVTSAPTLWGDELHNIPLLTDCQKLLQRPVVMLNDISAAVWRYAELYNDDFCLYTISSGVGNKVFRHGEILLNEQGQGGELGHCQVAFDEFALPCDCGGSGHLGALASGRGVQQLAQFMASLDPSGFKCSRLGKLCESDFKVIDTLKIVSALQRKDPFTVDVLKRSQRYLVSTMSQLYHAIGIKKFLFIGGFCRALGELYINSLRSVVNEFQWFGLSKYDKNNMCQLGVLDDDHSLLGMGLFMRNIAHQLFPATDVLHSSLPAQTVSSKEDSLI